MYNQRLLKLFRSFYKSNYPDDMESLIELFSIFGGLDVTLDVHESLRELIQKHIVDEIYRLERIVNSLLDYNDHAKRLLKALASSNRKIFSTFNKAGLNNQNGGIALDDLVKKDLVWIEYSREVPPSVQNPNEKLPRDLARYRISHKLLFSYPFLRFWFYFVEPNIRSLKNGESERFFALIEERFFSYTSLVFEELSSLLLNYHLRDSLIISTGSYWDKNIEIDILTLTEDGKVFVAECKWSNHPVSKSILTKLEQKCVQAEIEPDLYVLFSKRGFSNELKKESGKGLLLFSSGDFELLLKNITDDEFDDQCFLD
ncbi:MAG: DUF234 domain-containing protein [Sulfuricurvum sp.]